MSNTTKELIARTGRVQSWLDNPESRLPVSCCVFVVEDEMEGPNGIESSWRFVSHALRNGAGVAVHLSKLRGKDSDNGRGLVASGPVSFARIYSALNETLRRGGIYKNGAVVCHLDLDHADILEFITTKREELQWVKRCVDISQESWLLATPEVRRALLRGIASGDIWLNKIKYDSDGNRIYGNVCLEVYLPHRGTCLLQHVNLGACDENVIPSVFEEAMRELCELHSRTGVGGTGEYLDPTQDRQVGLGLLGLANYLAINGITYRELAEAFDRYERGSCLLYEDSDRFIQALVRGVGKAAAVARVYGMERAFAIAPTASCSYRYTDLLGYTTTPEIAPPIARKVDRDSGTFGVESVDYGDVQTASEVGWDDYFKVVNGVVSIFERTGLFHGYSFNSWSDVVAYDELFVNRWLSSPQTSLYYSLQVLPNGQDKSNILAALSDEDEVADLINQFSTDLFAPLTPEEEAAGRADSTYIDGFKAECIGCAE